MDVGVELGVELGVEPGCNAYFELIVRSAIVIWWFDTTGDWFMTIIKRCEKEVPGTWADKQLQAAIWLGHFVPHYSGRCVSVVDRHDCPAKHTTTQDNSKRWLDGEHAADKVRIAALWVLVGRMKADVGLYIHGYNTCAVECAHGERTVLTSKRIEYWTNWEGKCRLVQLLHNHRTRATGHSLLQGLGWQVTDGVSTQLGKIDRDKAKHHGIKTSPAYNGRKKAIRVEKKTRSATDPELMARAAAQKQKTREKQRHYYSAKKQLLYEAEGRKTEGGDTDVAAVQVVVRKRGQPRKTVQTTEDGDKENVDPGAATLIGKKKMKIVGGEEEARDS